MMKNFLEKNHISHSQINKYADSFNKLSENIINQRNFYSVLDILMPVKRESVEAKEVQKKWADFIKNNPNAGINLYIHVPFCILRCDYCHNPSNKLKDRESINRYLKNIKEEMKFFSSTFKYFKFQKLSIGGGTPNLLSPFQTEELLKSISVYFRFKEGARREVEFNPAVTTRDHIFIYKKYGFNRISFGVQSLSTKALKAANRAYFKYEMIEKSVKLCREIGIRDVNIDLILGFVEESSSQFEKNLTKILKLDPSRIEIYVLKPISSDYLSMHVAGNERYFISHQEKMIRSFLKNITNIKKGFNYILGDPWGKNTDFSKDPLSLTANYFVLIKNDPSFYANYREAFSLSQCFGMGQYSISNIFSNCSLLQEYSFSPKKRIYNIALYDRKYEMKKYVMKTLGESGKIYLDEFKKIFKTNLLDKFRCAVEILLKIKKIRINGGILFFLAKRKKEIFGYSIFFIMNDDFRSMDKFLERQKNNHEKGRH